MSGSQQLLLGGNPQAVPVDPFFYSVTSLLHGDGTNGAQNNTFLDSSTNNFTITRNGNTTQGSFSPFSQTGWGNYFNGSSYISAADNAALDLGTGDFTIEGWVYIGDGIADNAGIVSKRSSTTFNTGDYRISYRTGTSKITFADDLVNERSTPVVQKNSWTHFAIVRASGTLSAYANGVRGDTAADSVNLTNGEIQTIGVNATIFFTGYMSNIRIVKGTAVYSGATYTVPTAPLTAITNTSLLTCQANRFLDASSNAFTISTSGSPSVQPFSPFNQLTPYSTSAVGGSGYFDGSGDYLQNTSVTNQFDVGSAFTLELWVYVTTYQEAGWINVGGSTVNWSTTTGLYWSLYQFGGTLYWQTGNGSGSAISMITATSPSAGAWHHVAIGYNGTTTRMWIDGASVGTSTSSYFKPSGTDRFQIGGFTGGAPVYQGYMSGVRFVKGTDVYGVGNTTLTVPTAPLTAITNTSLLCNFTNAGIFDNAADADYETVGNAQISTSVKKYGTGSMAFDGTGDYLTIPYNQFMNFGTGDFTIEGWFYLNSFANQYYVLGGTWTTGTSDEWLIQIENNGSLRFLTTANTSFFATGLIKTGTWYHFAASRNAGVIKAYINGTAFATIANTNSIGSTSKVLNIGQQPGGTWPWNGYVDDWRISKGVGRYPYNFTPPTAEFPNIGGTVTLTADPYYDYTTLLLPGNGTNGAQNNTFLDSSTNNFTITRNGNTTQGTFSPFSQTGWGNYFDGTLDYIQSPSNAALAFDTGDFTIECWGYGASKVRSFPYLYSNNVAYGANFIGLLHNPDAYPNKVVFYVWNSNSSAPILISGSTITNNQWFHAAVTRSGSTFRLFINGSLEATATYAGSVDGGGTKVARIGCGPTTSSDEFNGYVSNARVVKGTAVYTATFTVPTTPLTAITNTSLLTCQSNRFVDNSSNAFAITRNGDVSVQAFSPFNPTAAWSASTNGGSGYFDGSGDYLTVPDNAALQMGSGDFTIEYWWYPNNITGYQNPIDKGYAGAGAFLLQTGNGDGRILVIASGSIVITSSTAVTVNAWNHMAVVRSGTTLTLYQNGVSVGSATNSTNFNNTTQLGIGATGAPVIGSFPVVGYLSNVRFVKGTAVYSGSTYTVPTAPLTAISGTSLLLNYTNAGIYDATSKNDLETVGNAQISTTQSKFGGSSMLFDGTGDWLRTPTSPNLDMGTGDLTIEGWFYLTATVAVDYRMIVSDATNGNNYVAIRGGGTGGQLEVNVNGTSFRLNLNNSVTINTWFHLAVTRYNGTWYGFVNGASLGSNASAAAFNLGNGGMFVGRFGGATAYEWPGYMDDLRITKGIARYTSNFTPPTTAFLTL
jgi:hypothetical protein